MRPTPALLAAALALGAGACGVRTAPPEDVRPPPPEWSFTTAEHVALWYHALALVRAPAQGVPPADGAARAEQGADTLRAPSLPLYRDGYADSISALKRRRTVYPTELDRRADEFARRLAGEPAYGALQFLPLYFEDGEALFSGVDLWRRLEGDPRRAGSEAGARVVAFLSSLFPRSAQRRDVVEFVELVQAEAAAFYDAYWLERQPILEARAAAARQRWSALRPRVDPFLTYMRVRSGEAFLVPAIGAEGRMLTRGALPPRVAIMAPDTLHDAAREPDAAAADPAGDVVFSLVRELTYPLAAEAVSDYVAPARIREIGQHVIVGLAAVRGGAVLLDLAAPDRADDYRRFFLAQIGTSPPAAPDDLQAAFQAAFPLQPDLERGLDETIRQALAGI